MSAYEPYENLISEAYPNSGMLRLFSGMVLLFVGMVALQVGFINLLQTTGLEQSVQSVVQGSEPVGALLALYSFILPFLVLWVVLRLLHDRAISGVLGPVRLAVRDFFKVMRLLIVLFAVLFLVPSPAGMEPVPQLAFGTWLKWLPLALVGLLIQVTCEEFIFRGYLQSQMAARFRNPAIWLVIPSALFGVVHYAPSIYGENAALVAIWAFAFGMIAADMTARTGSLGPAIALHFVNNVSGLLLVATEGHLSGLALMVLPMGPDQDAIIRMGFWIGLPTLLCMWLVARIAVKR